MHKVFPSKTSTKKIPKYLNKQLSKNKQTLSDIKSTIQRKVDKVVEKMVPPPPEDNIKKDIEDVASEAKSIIERALGDISKTSATQQLLIGSASGWVTGVVATKFGKLLAVALGGGIIALQVANHQGYITVNWDQIMRRVDKVADKVEERVNKEGPKWMDKVGVFARRNTCLAAGFLGGFFIGMSHA